MNDNSTTIYEIKQKIQLFHDQRDWNQFHTPKDVAIMVVTEASELLELFRFKSDEQIAAMLKDPSKRKDIEHEVADVLHSIATFANIAGIDISTAFQNKLLISEKKYPVDKVKGNNLKSTEYEESWTR